MAGVIEKWLVITSHWTLFAEQEIIVCSKFYIHYLQHHFKEHKRKKAITSLILIKLKINFYISYTFL